jgi:hypothetical protein
MEVAQIICKVNLYPFVSYIEDYGTGGMNMYIFYYFVPSHAQ